MQDTDAVRMSLRLKIAGGFVLLLLLIVLLGWVTFSLFGSTQEVQREVFDQAVPALQVVDEIVRSYTAQSASVSGYLIVGRRSVLDSYRREKTISERAEQRAERLFTDPEEQEALDQLRIAGLRYQELVDDEIVPLAEEGSRSLAFSLLVRDGVPLLTEIETLGSVLAADQDRAIIETEETSNRAARQALVILLIVVVGALGVGAVLAVLLPRRLSGNLSKLVTAARAIERGDLDQSIDIQSHDEIEELAVRFVAMQAGLKRAQQLAVQEHELDIAAEIQKSLLQRSMPDIPGIEIIPIHRQANLVGGDWYDVDSSGGQVRLAVGDASGKGIGAALMATVVLSVLRAERRFGSNPKRIIERANETLREAAESESFTTMIYATIDPLRGDVSWLNMGHPAPFVLRSHMSDEEKLRGYYLEGPRNRVLGWYDDPGLTETVARLHPGDRLVFFTDGFLEAKSAEGEVFGEHRLAEALIRSYSFPLDSVGGEVARDVEEFAAGKLDDDLTMLVVEFQGAPGGTTEIAEDRAEIQEHLTGDETWHSRR